MRWRAQARAEVAQIGELIDDVLFLSELESGRAVVSLGSTRALPVLDEIVAARAERSANAGSTMHVDCPAELELPLRPRMLETIAANLVDNALRYAGRVTTFSFRARDEGGGVVLSGTDNGHGVPREDLPRLFERFFRSDRARSSHGTGLGLAIVKHIVTSAGGSAEARLPRAAASRFAVPSRAAAVTRSLPNVHHRAAPATVRPRRDSRAMKRLASAAALACALLLAAGCGGGTAAVTTILADGSSTVGPFATRAAENFKQQNPDVEVTVGISGTGGGFERFCADEIDLSNASRPIDEDEEQLCADAGVEFVELPVANDALTVVVNPENDWATCLTVEQLKAIWEPGSTIKNWQDVDPSFPDEPLRLYGPGTDSGTFDYFTGADRRRGGREPHRLPGLGGRQRHHRRRHRRRGRARILRLLVLRAEPGHRESGAGRQRLGCVTPSAETAQDGTYAPLSRPLFVYAKTTLPRTRRGRRSSSLHARQRRRDRRTGRLRAADVRRSSPPPRPSSTPRSST